MNCLIDLDGTILNFWDRFYTILNDSLIAGCIPETFALTDELIRKPEYILMRRSGMNEKLLLNTIGITNTKEYFARRRNVMETDYYLDFDKLFNVKKLEKYDYKILITYRQNRKTLIKQLKKLNIYYLFDKIITPKGESIFDFKHETINKYKSKDCVMIGDAKIDIISAKNNGVYSIGVLSGISDSSQMQSANPDKIINSIDEL